MKTLKAIRLTSIIAAVILFYVFVIQTAFKEEYSIWMWMITILVTAAPVICHIRNTRKEKNPELLAGCNKGYLIGNIISFIAIVICAAYLLIIGKANLQPAIIMLLVAVYILLNTVIHYKIRKDDQQV